MFCQSIIAAFLLASAPEVLCQKVAAPAHIPECSTKCMTIKLTEAATWFGPGDLATYCTRPQFLVAYNNCLKDHCHGDDIALGQQAGAAACGTNVEALNATIPSTGGNNSSSNPTATGHNTTLPINSTATPAANGSDLTPTTGSDLTPTTGSPLTASHNATSNTTSVNPITSNSTSNSTGTPRSSNNGSSTTAGAGAAANSASSVKTDLFFASSLALSLGFLFL